jgi:hypothetical protein
LKGLFGANGCSDGKLLGKKNASKTLKFELYESHMPAL